MTQLTLAWREPGPPRAGLAPGQIAFTAPPAGETGECEWVMVRGFDGMGKGPIRFSRPSEGSEIHATSQRS